MPLAAIALLLAASASAADLRFGMSASPTSPEMAARQAKALEPYLNRVTGRKVTVVVAPTFEALARDMSENKLDAAWMPPFTFLLARSWNTGVEPVAKAIRNGAALYLSVLFTKAGKGATLADFKGKKVAWVDPNSTSGYLFPQAMFKDQGIDPATYFKEQKSLGSHGAVCKAVASGKFDLGATFADVPLEGKTLQIDGCSGHTDIAKLAVIDVAGTVPNDVIAVRPGLAIEDSKAVQVAVIALSETKEGAELLKNVFVAEGFESADLRDFVSVEKAWKALGSKP